MRPSLFHIGSVDVPAFFLMVMMATLAATFYGYFLSKRENADPVVLLDFGIAAIIGSVIGARIFHIVIENPSYYWEAPMRVFYFWQGGFVSIGAFVFSIASIIIYLKIRRLDSFRYLDIAAVAVPVAIFFVRMGCLLVGCCYGKPTNFFIHLTFNDPASTAGNFHLGVPLHATQVYFMINAVIMEAVLFFIYKHRKFKGQVMAAFLMYYGVTRFFIEFLRGDTDRGLFFGGSISTGQIAMMASFCTGGILYIILVRRNHKSPSFVRRG